MTEHMIAVFASESAAAAAERELRQAGLPQSAIRRYAEGASSASGRTAGAGTVETTESSGGGFWAWLLGEETETTRQAYPDDGSAYDRSLASGHYVLSVAVADDSLIHEVVTILERHEPLDIDEHTEEDASAEADGRSSVAVSGTDYSSGATATPAAGASMSGTAGTGRAGAQGRAAGMGTGSASTTGASATGSAAGESGRTNAGAGASGREEVIPLAEEQLEVGTRMVDRGTRRVRRYVVEKPVEREVTLHGERVVVERRRPTEARGDVPASAFEERVVEVHETEEVPDVRKTARVVEEVAIRREETERKERVQDTVRRDELEMAPEPKDKRQQG